MTMHYHKDEQGFLVRCYHKGRLGLKTWILAICLATAVFPIEHYVWTHIPPFTNVAEFLGIGLNHDDHEHQDQ